VSFPPPSMQASFIVPLPLHMPGMAPPFSREDIKKLSFNGTAERDLS